MAGASSISPSNETVTLKLPSGEMVDAIVPAGLSDEQVGLLMKSKHPDSMVPDPKKSLQMQGGGPTDEQRQAINRNMEGIASGYAQALPLMLGGGINTQGVTAESIPPKAIPEQMPSIPTAELEEKVALPNRTVQQAKGLGLVRGQRMRSAAETGEALGTPAVSRTAISAASIPLDPSTGPAINVTPETVPPKAPRLVPSNAIPLPKVIHGESAASHYLTNLPEMDLRQIAGKRGIDVLASDKPDMMIKKIVSSMSDGELKEFQAQAAEQTRFPIRTAADVKPTKPGVIAGAYRNPRRGATTSAAIPTGGTAIPLKDPARSRLKFTGTKELSAIGKQRGIDLTGGQDSDSTGAIAGKGTAVETILNDLSPKEIAELRRY